MKKQKVEFVAGVNNLYNTAGNNIREIEDMLMDEKSTKANVLELVTSIHTDLYNQGTALGLVFDEAGATAKGCKSCD